MFLSCRPHVSRRMDLEHEGARTPTPLNELSKAGGERKKDSSISSCCIPRHQHFDSKVFLVHTAGDWEDHDGRTWKAMPEAARRGRS